MKMNIDSGAPRSTDSRDRASSRIPNQRDDEKLRPISLDRAKEMIDLVLNTLDGESFDICAGLYGIVCLLNEDDQPLAFKYVCERYGVVESNQTAAIEPSAYGPRKDGYKRRYGDFVNSLLALYINLNLPELDFYSNLWRLLNDTPIFSDEGIKTFAFYYILIDKRIPYFHIDLKSEYSLSDAKFCSLRDEHFKDIQRIRFILNRDFDQRTERASILLNEFGISAPDASNNDDVAEYEGNLLRMIEVIRFIDSDELRRYLASA